MMTDRRGGADLEANYPGAGIPVAQAVPVSAQGTANANDVAYAQQVQAEEMESLDKMERSIRHQFARKVFGLLALQIMLMMAVICIFMYVPAVRAYCRTSASTWLTLVSGFVFLVVTLSLTCIPQLNKQYPINLVGLFVISVLAGVFIGTFAADIAPDYVWIAFAATMGLMLVLGLFACQTRYDFTGIGPYLTVGMMLLFVFALFGGFAPVFRSDWSNGGRGIVFMALVLFLLCMYVVYDIQLVLGGKHRLRFGVDDYIVATISLFTDFLLIFVTVLGAMGSQN